MGSCDEKGSENEQSRKDSPLPTATFYFIFGARCPWESGSMTPTGDKCLYPPVHSSCFCRGNRTSASQEGASLRYFSLRRSNLSDFYVWGKLMNMSSSSPSSHSIRGSTDLLFIFNSLPPLGKTGLSSSACS